MKRVMLLALVLMLLMFSSVYADNNIMIMTDYVSSPVSQITFGYENDVELKAVSNGFLINTNGPLTAQWDSGSHAIDTISRDGQIMYSGWLVSYHFGDDTLLAGAASL